MKRGKYEKIPPKRRNNGRKLLVLLCLMLILCLTVGGTLAYVIRRSASVTNTFAPAQVSCEVVNNSDGTVSVKNTSNIPACVRASYVVNWMDSSGNISGTKPVEDKDYSISVDGNWILSDGIYYYNDEVSVDDKKAFVKVNVLNQTNGDYNLVVEVVAEAIQADGLGVGSAIDAWTKARGSNN